MSERRGSSLLDNPDLLNTPTKKTDLFVRIKHHSDRIIVVSLLNLRYVDANEKYEVLRTLFKIPGVVSVSLDDSENIIVTGTVDPITIRKELKRHRPVLVLSRPTDEEGGSEQLDGELPLEEAYSDETCSKLRTETPSVSSKSGDSDSGNDITAVASKTTTTALKNEWDSDSGNDITAIASKTTATALNNEWDSFREFLSNRLHPLTISVCTAKDVIDFLRLQLTSGVEAAEALVGYLSATCEAHGIKPMEYPFHSLAVTTFLKSASEVTAEKECILVFSCNDYLDVEETSFIEAISKELHKHEVTPLSPWIIWWKSWSMGKQQTL